MFDISKIKSLETIYSCTIIPVWNDYSQTYTILVHFVKEDVQAPVSVTFTVGQNNIGHIYKSINSMLKEQSL